MTPNVPIPIPDVRKYLETMMDDEFDAFCLDNFLDVHQKFSNGMALSTKINVLIKKYSRSPTHQSIMVRCFNKSQHHVHESWAFELLEVHRFDLASIVQSCVRAYKRSQESITIAIRSDVENVIDCIKKRIIHILGESEIQEYHFETIILSRDRLYRQKDLLLKIKERLQGNVIFSYMIDDEQRMYDFLQFIHDQFRGPQNNRYLFLIGTNKDISIPEDVLQFEEPIFDEIDFQEWIADVRNRCGYPKEVFNLWQNVLFQECISGGKFDLGTAYSHLYFITDKLSNGNINPVELDRLLRERQRLHD